MVPTVHMIAQAHLDPVWLWRWTEGRAEALATSKSAIDRLREYPELHMVRGEAQVYRWIEDEDPELFAQILEMIRAGRWHVVNGMVVQPDMNLLQGESLVRQVLLGKSYMRKKLGVDVKVAYCVDSFGHAGTLPQILKKCGFDYYVFMRPGAHEKNLPAQAFRWRGPDGSELLAFRIPLAYTTRTADAEKKIDDTVADMPSLLNDTMCFFGVGNHGGGPTRAQIDNIMDIARRRDDLKIIFSHPQAYFEQIATSAAKLPVVADELQMHAIGCYSLNSTTKKLFRQAECSLLIAERIACLAEIWAGKPVPRPRLAALWHDLSFNEFHDILAASSIKEAQDEANMTLASIVTAARAIANDAGRYIAARVNTRGPGGSVVMFNPFPYRRQEYVEYEPWTDWEAWDQGDWGLVDDAGCAIPYQQVEPQSALNSERSSVNRLLFPVDLPPLGYRVYHFARSLKRARLRQQVWVDQTSIRNAVLTLQLSPMTGNITSCRHRASGVEFVGAGSWNVGQVLEDTSDTWSHGEQGYTHMLGQFMEARICIGEQGPLQASLFIKRKWECSTWLQEIILRADSAEILIRNWLHWMGQQRVVKLAFTLPISSPMACRDVPFGSFPFSPNGQEIPLQMWMDVTGRGTNNRLMGLTLINDSKYGGDVNGATMRLTVLRCPPYAYDRAHSLGTKLRYDWVDQGLQEFTLCLRPHLGDWRDADVVRRARELNMPIVPITMHAHEGDLPAVNSLAALDSDEIELTALKPAEDGRGYILRLADKHGRGGQGHLAWLDGDFAVSVSPHEVVTLRLDLQDGTWVAHPCDMLEQPGQ